MKNKKPAFLKEILDDVKILLWNVETRGALIALEAELERQFKDMLGLAGNQMRMNLLINEILRNYGEDKERIKLWVMWCSITNSGSVIELNDERYDEFYIGYSAALVGCCT